MLIYFLWWILVGIPPPDEIVPRLGRHLPIPAEPSFDGLIHLTRLTHRAQVFGACKL